MNSASHESIGLWITIAYGTLLGLLSLAWLCRQLYLSFNPRLPIREGPHQLVTRGELQDSLERLERTISNFVSRGEYEAKHKDISDRVETLDRYMHERFHEVLGGQQTLINHMAILTASVEREIGRREGAARVEQ